ADALLRRCLGVERARGKAQRLPADGDLLAGAQSGFDLLPVDRRDDGREESVVVGVLVESLFVVVLVRLRRQLGEAFRTAVAVAPVVVEHALAERGARRLLVR